MKVLFHIFGIPVYFFGVMIALGMLVLDISPVKCAAYGRSDNTCVFCKKEKS